MGFSTVVSNTKMKITLQLLSIATLVLSLATPVESSQEYNMTRRKCNSKPDSYSLTIKAASTDNDYSVGGNPDMIPNGMTVDSNH